MTPKSAPAAVALHAPASQYVGLRPARRLSLPAITVTPAGDGAVAVIRAKPDHRLKRLVSGLADVAGLLAVACAFPLAILAIGIPIALFVRLVLWVFGGL